MANIDEQVRDVIEDLKAKINNITTAGSEASGKTLSIINELKKKTISVLTKASDKVIETSKNYDDSSIVEKGVEIVKQRSQDLYDKTISKINELASEDGGLVQEQDNKNEEKTVIVDKHENHIEESNDLSDLDEKAHRILKEWLRPEGK